MYEVEVCGHFINLTYARLTHDTLSGVYMYMYMYTYKALVSAITRPTSIIGKGFTHAQMIIQWNTTPVTVESGKGWSHINLPLTSNEGHVEGSILVVKS